jgi:predicted DNA-binding protein (MmcQ/YjbR family)
MIEIHKVRELALNFEAAEELPHFEKTSFRVKKKIFATLDIGKKQVVLKLSETDQSVFCTFDSQVIYPVSGGWGKKGWTVVELQTVGEEIFKDALRQAYCEVAPTKLAKHYKLNDEDLNWEE